jgi:rhodanese-related sulfurtransferase
MESSTFLLIDENGHEHAIFSGDTLFLGDVGRPDLAIKSDVTQEDLAGYLFDSLRNRIMPLPDGVIVYPGHGAGSSCGKNLSSETVDSLGNQKMNNYALRADMTREEFVKEITDGLLPPPQYFPKNAMMNKNGYESIDSVFERGNKPLTVEEFKKEKENGAIILDTRLQDDFIKGHIPNSLYIGLHGNFAMWVGALISDIKQKIILIAPEGQEKEAVMRLARVGYDHAVGYLEGGLKSWGNAEERIDTVTSVTPQEFEEIYNEDMNIVDVRKPGEYDAQRIKNAQLLSLDFIHDQLDDLDKDKTYYVHCAGGYRSVSAISILQPYGYKNLINIGEGFNAIKNSKKINISDYTCPSTAS